MEQTIEGHVPPAIPDLDLDPRYGTWDTHVIQEKLLLTHNVTDGNVNDIFYFPVAYGPLMVHPDKLLELSDALFYTPVSLEYSVENVNCQRDIKLTGTESTPLPINEIGIYFYDPTGNMLIADSQFPYAEATHHNDMIHIIVKSMLKERSELLKWEIMSNNYPTFGTQMTMAPSFLSRRDPNFKEKNNESDTVFFKNVWTNDVGMRINIQALLAPPRRNETRPYMIKNGATWTESGIQRDFEYVTVAPFDYRRGYMTNPPGEDRMLSAHAKKHKKLKYCETRHKAQNSVTSTTKVIERKTSAFGPRDDLENNFTRVIMPYDADEWMGQSWRKPDSLMAILQQNGRKIWTKQTHDNYFNNTTPFSGQKTIKPFFMKFGPSWNGLNFQPYFCHFEFNYIMTVKVFRYQPFLERPVFPPTNPATKRNYTSEELRYSADMTYMRIHMHNPFLVEESTGVPADDIPNAFNRQFIPAFQNMPISFKKSPRVETIEEE